MTKVPQCGRCKQPLRGRYIQARRLKLHAHCFTCDRCQQALNQDFHFQDGQLFHPVCYRQQYRLVCTHCQAELEAQWTEFQGKKYHPACYQQFVQPRCYHCQKPISGAYRQDSDALFHPVCYATRHDLFCNLCQQPLTDRYLTDLWGNKGHLHHGNLPTLQCQVCARLISQTTSNGGVQFGDGRVVCGICQITAIDDPQQVQQAKTSVLEQLKTVGFTYIPEYVAVTLAEQHLLQWRMQASPSANIHGYTKTLDRQVPGLGLVREHSIFVLHGLPRVAFMGVLAHELLHVWLQEHRLNHLSKATTEGFCNLGSALIYQNEGSPLAQVLLQRLWEDPDAVYGVGYRQMRPQLEKLGWPGLLAALLKPPAPLSRWQKLAQDWLG